VHTGTLNEDTTVVAKIKYPDEFGPQLQSQIIRGIRQPSCYGCSSTTCIGAQCSGNTYTWKDWSAPESEQTVCSGCDVDKRVWIFEVAVRNFANEVAYVTSASTVSQPEFDRTTFLNIESEFDIGNKIYVMEDTKPLAQAYNRDDNPTILHSVPIFTTESSSEYW